MPKPKFVTAIHKETGEPQTVPAHYVDNPNIFGGVFTLPPRRKKPARKREPVDPNPIETPADGENQEGVIPYA